MNPALKDVDLLEVIPCSGESLGSGDVILFLPPDDTTLVVHRVIRRTFSGIITRGDNNALNDPWLLQPAEILGRVVVAWRGNKKRMILGGRLGLFLARLLRSSRLLEAAISRPLHPIYRRLAASGRISRLVPHGLRPRRVLFMDGGERCDRLLFGRHMIGHYDQPNRSWQIQRPFRLLIDPRLLEEEPGRDCNPPAGDPLVPG